MKRLTLKRLDWWRPLWRGLVYNSSGKHRKKMGSAIWLYLYLLLHVDMQTGKLNRSLVKMAREMGVPEKTARKWLKRLKNHGYVIVEVKNKQLYLQVVHYRSFRR